MDISDSDIGRMLYVARTAMSNAYAPYSGFRVGAAVLCSSGTVYGGCNVENASYPVSLCAERNALAAAIASGERELLATLIVSDAEIQCPPCGLCRQALYEFGPDSVIILADKAGNIHKHTLSELLPYAFGPKFISKTRCR